jgi:hypothetical protein
MRGGLTKFLIRQSRYWIHECHERYPWRGNISRMLVLQGCLDMEAARKPHFSQCRAPPVALLSVRYFAKRAFSMLRRHSTIPQQLQAASSKAWHSQSGTTKVTSPEAILHDIKPTQPFSPYFLFLLYLLPHINEYNHGIRHAVYRPGTESLGRRQ